MASASGTGVTEEKQALPETNNIEDSMPYTGDEKSSALQDEEEGGVGEDEEEELRPTAPNTRGARIGAGGEQRPSRWRRLLVIIAMLVIFWLISSIRSAQKSPPKVVHASRYSKEYKFRPAASPIITEQLKDGRTRIRGAEPTFRATDYTASPTASPIVKPKGKAKGKAKAKGKPKTYTRQKK